MFNKTILGLAFGSLMFIAGSAVAANYEIDTKGQHAFINFKISHLGFSWIYGRFNNFSGTFVFDENDLKLDKIHVTIKTASVDTNQAERDKHLRGPGFLDESKFPEIKFESTNVEKMKEDGDYKIKGDLTLNGVIKPVILNAKMLGKGPDPWGGNRVGFEASGTIKLQDFNIEKAKGLGSASQEVKLMISGEGLRKNDKSG